MSTSIWVIRWSARGPPRCSRDAGVQPAAAGERHGRASCDRRAVRRVCRSARALEAFELYAVAFGAEVPDATPRLAAVRAGELANGVGARMLRAVEAWDWAMRGGSAGACAELASAALADGTLIAADPGFMTIVAAGVLVLADQDEVLAVWEAAMAEAHRVGSAFAVCGVDLWRGWTWLQRGELAEAENSLRAALEGTLLVEDQYGVGMDYVSAFLSRVLLERGDLAAARTALANRGDPSPAPTATRSGAAARSNCCWPRRGGRRHWPRPRSTGLGSGPSTTLPGRRGAR
jgi:hypothetical protein